MAHKTPFFSVIIPTLNEESVISLLLDDLLAQTERSFEVILADGFSEDKTLEIAKSYKNKFESFSSLQTVSVPRTKSVSPARNRGAEIASGTYYIFFDADVRIPPDFLDGIYKDVQKSHALLLTTKIQSDDTDWSHQFLTSFSNYLIRLALFTPRQFLMGFNIIIEKNLFRAIGGFDETLLLAEDHMLAHQAYKRGSRVRFLWKPVLTASMRRFRREGKIKVLVKYIYSTLYLLIRGPIRKPLYEYNMGGKHT